jgi:phosphate-selective porin OprO/OprP
MTIMPAVRKWAPGWALALTGCALWGAAAGTAKGEEPPDLRSLREEVRQRQEEIDRQTRLIEEMKKRVGQLDGRTAAPAAPDDLPPPPPADRGTVEKMVGEYLQRRDAERAAQEAAEKARADEEGYKVGSDLKMSVHWSPLNGVTFETPHRDFWSRLGLYAQFDNVWFTQSPGLKSPSQIGDLQDGFFFRRIRPEWEGQAWEVMEWDVLLQLEQVSGSVPQLTEVWVGLMKLPILGTVRVGKQRIPQGIEVGSFTGNRAGTFMEESASGSAFYQNTAPGIWNNNSVLDQHVTWTTMFYRQDNVPGGINAGQNGVSFGDGKYAYAGRLTALPIYENDGRCLLHLGASYGWRKAETAPGFSPGQPGVSAPNFVDFRTRPLLRDSIGDYGTPPLSGNSKQLIDTGLIPASSSTVVGTEFLYILGPFSAQAEWTWGSANDAVIPNPHPGKGKPANVGLGDVWFNGGYVQLSYFLTGENRRYDRRYGRLSRNPLGPPNTPFFLTRGEDSRWLFGSGAWELAARWNHLNLDKGYIQGGQTDAYEAGINWYLNSNFRIEFEYLHQDRYQKSTGPNGNLPGDIDGFGIRTQLYF